MDVIADALLCKVTICAVIFGADETILNLSFGEGFEIRRMSLAPSKDNLTSIFDASYIGLRREYEEAVINNKLDVICVYKSYETKLLYKEAQEYFEDISNEALIYLDNRIRAVRLFYEGAIRFKKLSLKMESETKYLDELKTSFSYNSIIPIGEAMVTKEISRLHLCNRNIEGLMIDIPFIEFPLSDSFLNDCHRYYDLSYHHDNAISITLLATCLEILFLKKGDSKKKILAKRCSVFLHDSEEERLKCYDKLIKSYEKRSEFVHEGNSSNIFNEDILFLRDCVRKSLIKYINHELNKDAVVKELKVIIGKLDYLKNI